MSSGRTSWTRSCSCLRPLNEQDWRFVADELVAEARNEMAANQDEAAAAALYYGVRTRVTQSSRIHAIISSELGLRAVEKKTFQVSSFSVSAFW